MGHIREGKMPILQSFGPTRFGPTAGHVPMPPPATGLSAAARRHGVLPVPSLEWNDQVARETAPLYARIAYVNTSADVKAEVDICCTSSNAVEVVESLGADTVIFLPDQYLANYVATQTKVKIIAWKGACEVHERFTAEELRNYRAGDAALQ